MARILVCEDDPNVREVIVEALTQAGHQVLEAERGDVALQLASTYLPALVLTNDDQPGLTGEALLWQLRRDPRLACTPVIFVTGFAERISTAARQEAMALIEKPFRTSQLLAVVQRVLGGEEIQEETG
ncbi:MAG TPA: response regulator [Armatimonadetes bacterium]|nr:response regulator [Armatimonadota bacterium]